MKSTYKFLPLLALILPLALLTSVSPAHGKRTPRVTNVQFKEIEYKPGWVEIIYDLDAESDAGYNVKVVFSNESGTETIKPKMLSGDVGKGITAGSRRRILWEAEKDCHEGLPEGNYVCRVTAYEPGKSWPWIVGGGFATVAGVGYYLYREGIIGPGPEQGKGTVVVQVPKHP